VDAAERITKKIGSMGTQAQEEIPVRKESFLEDLNQQNKPAMSDDSQEDVVTVARGKKKKVSGRQGQGYQLGSGIKEDRQDKELDKAYQGDGTAMIPLQLVSSSSAKREVSLGELDTESATEDDDVEASNLVYAVKDEQSRGSRSRSDLSDCMGKPKQGYKRNSPNDGVQGWQAGTTINEDEQRHVLVACLKDISTLESSRKKTLMRSASEKREKLTVESIRERFALFSGVNNSSSQDLSVDLEEFYKTQRALIASYNLRKSEGEVVYHRLAGQGQISASTFDRGSMASKRGRLERNHVSFVFVVHKKKGLLLKKIEDGSLLRYEVPRGVVRESDYAAAGKVSVPPLIAI
jgi:hypothetical protein